MTNSTTLTYHITLGGRTYRVEIISVGKDSAVVEVDGSRHEIEIGPHGGDPARGETVTAPITPTPGQTWPGLEERARARASENVLAAPMPGDILGVKVEPGDRVTLGQELFVLEAMKMKSAIRSARDGVIESVEVEEGQSVSYGQPLLTYR